MQMKQKLNLMLNKIREIKERRLGKHGLHMYKVINDMQKHISDDVNYYTYEGLIVIKHFLNANVIHLNTCVFDNITVGYEAIEWNKILNVVNQYFPNAQIFGITEQKPKGYVVS